MTTEDADGVSTTPTPDSPLRWQVWIDWTGRRLWSAASDASADVLALRWQWGRHGLPTPEFAPPASLQLTVRNDDHRYTPGNTSGPLGGNVQTGRPIWLRVIRDHDDFATAGATPVNLDGRATSNGRPWQVLAVPGNGFVATRGEVAGQPGGWPPSDAAALVDTGDPLATLIARYRRGSNGRGGFVLRCAARDDCLRLRFSNDGSVLERVSGRTATRLASGSALDASAWYDLEIVQADGGVRVYATSWNAANAVRQEILASGPIAGAPESGRHGLWHAFRSAADRWGPFAVGRSLFSGFITAVEPDFDAATCRIAAADPLRALESQPLQRALAGGLMRSGNVAAAILGWAGLTPGDHALDDGRTLLTGGPRSVWGVTAGAALRQLQREENGLIHADGLGRIRLEAASVRSGVRANADPASLARFSVGDTAGGTGPYAAAIHRADGSEAVEEVVTFRYRRSSDAGRQLVWSLNESLEIPAGQAHELLASTDTWDVIQELATPVAGTDYSATDDAAGAGTDVTSNITIELIAESASGVAGRGHAVRVRNGGTGTAYLQTLDLYAQHCWRTQTSSAVSAAAPAGQAVADPGRQRVIRCRYADNYAAAEGAAKARHAERSRQRAQLEITVPLFTGRNHVALTEGRLSDVVAVRAAAQGITGAWLLEGMDVSVGGAGEGEARWWLSAVSG